MTEHDNRQGTHPMQKARDFTIISATFPSLKPSESAALPPLKILANKVPVGSRMKWNASCITRFGAFWIQFPLALCLLSGCDAVASGNQNSPHEVDVRRLSERVKILEARVDGLELKAYGGKVEK